MQFDTFPAWLNAAIFAGAAAFVYAAGTRLAGYADAIAERTRFSRVVLGLVLLGVATSLPEIATTVTAASLGNAALVSGNLFGGVSLQIAVLAIVDLIAVRGMRRARHSPAPETRSPNRRDSAPASSASRWSRRARPFLS